MLSLHFDELSWQLEPALEEGENFYSSLWLEFDSSDAGSSGGRGLGHSRVASDGGKVCRRLQVFSRQAPLMNAMITRCVEECDRCERAKPVVEGIDSPDGGDGDSSAAGGPVFVSGGPRT